MHTYCAIRPSKNFLSESFGYSSRHSSILKSWVIDLKQFFFTNFLYLCSVQLRICSLCKKYFQYRVTYWVLICLPVFRRHSRQYAHSIFYSQAKPQLATVSFATCETWLCMAIYEGYWHFQFAGLISSYRYSVSGVRFEIHLFCPILPYFADYHNAHHSRQDADRDYNGSMLICTVLWVRKIPNVWGKFLGKALAGVFLFIERYERIGCPVPKKSSLKSEGYWKWLHSYSLYPGECN